MKKLEVLTAHNVTISYDVATNILRAIASVIDIICVSLYLIILTAVLGVSAQSFSIEDVESLTVFIILFGFSVFFFYTPICEMLFKGQTLGKKIVGIRVVQLNGEKANLEQIIMRWAFRIVDLWMSFGAIAILSTSASEKGQRIGDRLANTTLIKTKPSTTYSLNDVLRIHTKDQYQPEYVNVIRFNDEDMMLLKKALSRLEKNPNEHHKKICLELADKCAQQLNLPKTPEKKGAFLKTILNDYIVLTR